MNILKRLLYLILPTLLILMLSPAAASELEVRSIEVSARGDYEEIILKTSEWASPLHTYNESSRELSLIFFKARTPSQITLPGNDKSRAMSVTMRNLGIGGPSVEVLVRFREDVKYDVANIFGKNETIIEFTGGDPKKYAREEKDKEQEKEEKIEISASDSMPGIPNLKAAGKFSIILNGLGFRGRSYQLFSNGFLMVPARHFFEAIDSQVSFDSKTGVMTVRRDEDRVIRFKIGDRKAEVNGGNFQLDTAPILMRKISGNVAYIPAISAARMVGYGVAWSEKDKALLLNPGLSGVLFDAKPPTYSVNLSFSDTVEKDRVKMSTAGNLMTIEVEDVIRPEGMSDVIDIGRGGFRKISIDKKGDRDLVVTLSLDEPKAYRASFSGRGDGFSVFFSTAIVQLKPVRGQGFSKIEMYSDGPITLEASSSSGPDRVVIDIPNAILTAPSKIQGSDGFVSSANASQYSFDPPTVRVAVSLPGPADFRTYVDEGGNKASLIIRWPKKPVKKSKPVEYSVLKGKVIVIEPAHGGHDPGGTGNSGKPEKLVTLPLAFRISEALERAGATVLLTREKDVKIPRKSVVRFANSNHADVFISVHYNSFRSKYMSGTETYYWTPQSRLLARILHKNLVNGIRRKNRGIRKVMYYTIHHTTMPSVLIEPAYITNPTEERLAYSSSFQKEVANDILKGLVEYFKAAGR